MSNNACRQRPLATALALVFLANPALSAFAATPLGAVRLVPDTAILLGANDQLATAGEVTRHVPAGNAAPVAIAGLPAAGVGIVGYHHAGGHYLAFDTSVVLGGVTFGARDVAFTDGAGTWSKYFDGVAAGIPDGVAIDALALDPADAALLLSFDTTVVLDGITFDPRDVARYAAGAFTLHAALSAQIPAGLDLVGLDALPSGHLLVALDGAASVGGVAFEDEDILEYTAPAAWELAYDGSAQDADWPAAGLAALAAETGAGLRVVPTAGLATTESGGFASFTVSLLGAPTADVTVNLSSSDTSEGTVAPASLTFTAANWGVAQGVTVTGVDDVLADGDVAYAVVATVASADPAYGGQFVVEVPAVNQDNEAPPPGSLQFSVASQSVAEGAGTLAVTVSRVGGSAGAVSVNYAGSPGTAAAPGDFSVTPETLYWADGDTADKTFAVAIVDDAAVEGAETFSLTLSAPDGGAGLGVPTVQTITINDNDVAPSAGSLQFSLASQSAGEGAGALTVTVSRVGGSAGAASVAYAVAGSTAQAPGDFAAVSGTLNWADGDSADQSFTVALVDDAAVEPEETFTVTLSGATGAGLGAPASQTVAIADDDMALAVAPVAIPALGPWGLALLAALLAGLAGCESRRSRRAMPRNPCN